MGSPRAQYRVRILYREPTYEMYAGPKKDPYQWTYPVPMEATTPPTVATAQALAEFREMERRSSVSWVREVVAVELVR